VRPCLPGLVQASVNLDLDDFDDDYLRQCSTATCPRCATVTEFDTLIVSEDRLFEAPDY
jgi:hypothetical protein